jgi:excisionase family DNA binding protein
VSASPYMTAQQACAYLQRTDLKAFYKAVKAQRIPHRRDGRHFLFKADELDRWLDERAAFVAGDRSASGRAAMKLASTR